MPVELTLSLLLAAIAMFLAGVYAEQSRARLKRGHWRKRPAEKRPADVLPFRKRPAPAANPGPTDAAEQLRTVMAAEFEKRRLLSRAEARVFFAAEKAARDQNLGWRVMAQVSLGEILWSANAKAFGAINSKRVDVLVIASNGDPIAAIEYQGEGHYQGNAPARDAVKKEALRRAGVRYIEVTPEHDAADLARELARIAARQSRAEPLIRPTPGR